jgi:sec-independent protein translocase protein TatB
MPDIGWQELFLIALVTIIVIGPKEIPRVLRTVSLWVRKIRGMASDFQSGIDDLAREADLEDFRKELADAKDFDIGRNIEDMIDPTGEYAKSIQDIEGSVESSLEDDPLDDFDDVDAENAEDAGGEVLDKREESKAPKGGLPAKTAGT